MLASRKLTSEAREALQQIRAETRQVAEANFENVVRALGPTRLMSRRDFRLAKTKILNALRLIKS
jgi:hypothetical protein